MAADDGGRQSAAQVSGPRPARQSESGWRSTAWSGCGLGLAAAVLAGLATAARAGEPEAAEAAARHAVALSRIRAADVLGDVAVLADPSLEGRDTPSLGLLRAAGHVAERLEAAGYQGLGPDGSMLWPFERLAPAPDPQACGLSRQGGEGSAPREYALERDFVPVWGSGGRSAGETVFLGFGIAAADEDYDELDGRDLRGAVAVIVEGEPERFDGPELSGAADLYRKLDDLERAGAIGALVVRRRATGPLAFRHTWARWQQGPADGVRTLGLPALEVAPAVADELFGADVLAWTAALDAVGRPRRDAPRGARVELSAGLAMGHVTAHNVVAWLPGADPGRAGECVVLGAHLDHLGVDPRGRIGLGADDNASGVAALLEAAEALAVARPRRGVLVCAFAGEEDGLLGSRAFCRDPPVPVAGMVAMLNLDMVGRGERDEVAVIGVLQNPELAGVLERARALAPTGVERLVLRQGQELFDRSDHYAFHSVGVPALFFFEGLPLERNPDYHTWRDTPDKLDGEKIAATARLAFNTAWLLAQDDERPPRPGP